MSCKSLFWAAAPTLNANSAEATATRNGFLAAKVQNRVMSVVSQKNVMNFSTLLTNKVAATRAILRQRCRICVNVSSINARDIEIRGGNCGKLSSLNHFASAIS